MELGTLEVASSPTKSGPKQKWLLLPKWRGTTRDACGMCLTFDILHLS